MQRTQKAAVLILAVQQYGLYQKEGSILMTKNNNDHDNDIIVHIEMLKSGF